MWNKTFDGDMMSCTITYSDESKQEVKDFLKSKRCYVNTDGKFTYNTNTDTVKYVLKGMTG